MNDGMSTTQFLVQQCSGTNAQFTNISGANVDASTLAAGASQIGTAEIGSGAVLAVNISGQQVTSSKHAFVATGSPTVYGNGIQFGTGTLGAGSDVWVVFGTGFKAAPVTVVSHNDGATTGIWVASGTANAGSVKVEGATASKAFNWMACGSY